MVLGRRLRVCLRNLVEIEEGVEDLHVDIKT